MKKEHSHIKIELSGLSGKTKNYVFEAYRLAVELNIKGYVKRLGGQMIEISVSGNPELITSYINQFSDLCSNNVNMKIINDSDNIIYNEFRILSGR
ncbi:MAG: acylphosphatase [Bacteroidales bacterium]|nr:acylphosphatase [Bacteroidales bacterium]